MKPVIGVAITPTPAAKPTAQAVVQETPRQVVKKSTLNDWAHTGNSDDDVNGFYASKEREKDRRRKKRRRNKEAEYEPVDWDDIYDPARPNNYEEYRDGEERGREADEWRERLYGLRKKGRGSAGSVENSEEEEYRPVMGSKFSLVVYGWGYRLIGRRSVRAAEIQLCSTTAAAANSRGADTGTRGRPG